MERRITSLGKVNVAKMRKEFNFRNINQIIEHYDFTPKSKKYSDAVKRQALELLKNDYNTILDIQNKDNILNSIVQNNNKYFERKILQKKNRKSSQIVKFFKNYNKPVNMEKRMKYMCR